MQREKKRQALESKHVIEHQDEGRGETMPRVKKIDNQINSTNTKVVKVKSNSKRRKVDVDERKLQDLVQVYRSSHETRLAEVSSTAPQRTKDKRWFD